MLHVRLLPPEGANYMNNQAFAQLSDAERVRKLDIAIRNHTGNLLTAEQAIRLNRKISLKQQYFIKVRPISKDAYKVLVTDSTLLILIPESLYRKESA